MRITKERYAEITGLIRAYLGPKGEPTDDAEVLADLRGESIPQSVLIGVICDLLDQAATKASRSSRVFHWQCGQGCPATNFAPCANTNAGAECLAVATHHEPLNADVLAGK